MSGFVGVWQRDGRPLEPALLAALTESLRFRGPDGIGTWHHGAIGLGHARFVTHARRNGQPQPLGLDDRHRIAGDIRLDAREELIAALAAPADASDAELVLRAYRAWGADCVTRIHGDFAFAIWDEPARRLFCARDPFGVKPFFYAAFADLLVVGNTLQCLRRHPRVSERLDELALADYLCCGRLLEQDMTCFAQIRRLRPGQTLLATGNDLLTRAYWALPVEPYRRHSNPRHYVEHFNDVLTQAVADRAGDATVSLSLSGGLDSGAIAAALAGRLGRPAAQGATRCYTVGWNCAFDDPEPDHARVTAEALQLPIEVLEEPDCEPFKDAATAPEADDNFYRESFVRTLGRMAGHARVALNGQGSDEVFYRELLVDEALRNPGLRLALDALRAWRDTGRRPPIGLPRLRTARMSEQAIEPWIDSAWARRLGLRERYRSVPQHIPRSRQPRAAARHRLLAPFWMPYVESYDPGFSGQLIETRWPFLDHRVIRLALSLPPFPWCVDKHLLRRALAPVLPPGIVSRPKTRLRGEPFAAYLAQDARWRERVLPQLHELEGFVDPAEWRRRSQVIDSSLAWSLGRPVSLAGWLATLGQTLRAA